MSRKPVARVGDAGSHGGVITNGASTIFVNDRPVARVGDIYDCPKHGPNPIVTGAKSVFGMGQLVAHVGSKTACGATITSGSPDTFVDDDGSDSTPLGFEQTWHPYDEQVQIVDEKTGEPLSFYPFYIEVSDGQIVSGGTDEKGYTPRIQTDRAERLEIWTMEIAQP